MKARAFLILLTSRTATFYRTAMPATAAASSEVRDVQPLQNMATKVNPVSCALGSRQLLLTRLQKVTLSVSRYVFLRGKQAGQLPRSPPNSFLSGMAGVSNNTPHSKKEHIVRRTEQRCSYPGIIIPIKKKKLREITELDSRKIASIHSNCFHGAQLVSNHCQQLGQATIVTISCTRHPSKRRIGHTMP